MRHRHQGPLDRACAGCLDEAAELAREERARVFKRVLLALFLAVLAVGSMALLSWRLR